MSRTYKATGINLKGMPLGESDRLLTILTRESGLIRVVAPGARKPKSKLGGRSGLFVVNELLIAQGRSLDKISQAETQASYSGLSRDLARLTASQYLAELVLCQALSEQPQEELFTLLCAQLTCLESATGTAVLATLAQSAFQLLTLAGIAPQVYTCCLTQEPLVPNFQQLNWRVGFSLQAGGTIGLFAPPDQLRSSALSQAPSLRVAEGSDSKYDPTPQGFELTESIRLGAAELALLQQLAQPARLSPGESWLGKLKLLAASYPRSVWLAVERVLRQYAQYHFERPIRSATLVDTCFCLPSAS